MAESAGCPAAFDLYDAADLRIAPDTHRAWVGIVFWATRFVPVWLVLATVAAASGEMQPVEAFAGLLLLVVPVAGVVSWVTSLWWLLGAGRVSYVVRDGTLTVRRGRRVLRHFPCAEITRLELNGAMTWKGLLLRSRIPDWPTLTIDRTDWPTTRQVVGPQRQRAILLWGEGRARRAEADLRRAVTLSGATLIETGDAG